MVLSFDRLERFSKDERYPGPWPVRIFRASLGVSCGPCFAVYFNMERAILKSFKPRLRVNCEMRGYWDRRLVEKNLFFNLWKLGERKLNFNS